MRSDNQHMSDMIEQATAALLERRAAYRQLLLFYKDIFLHQEAARRQCQLPEMRLEADLIEVKLRENFPLIRMDEFQIDAACSGQLLKTVCAVIQRHHTGLSDSAASILQAGTEQLNIDNLSKALLATDDRSIERAAGRLNIDAKALAFIVYTSLRPSLVECARRLAAQLPEGLKWMNGYCPVCGNYPALAELDENGRQNLNCHFCWHRWTVKRVFCAFCNDIDTKNQRYFYSETESNLRVNVCDKCGKYLKLIDLRETAYPVYPPLEQVSTLHLDIKAQEEGYHSALDPALKL